MTPHHQLYKHSPENGVYGDCFRTCMACLLDLQPSEVPHWFQMDQSAPPDQVDAAYFAMRDWLRERGYGYFTAIYQGELETVLECMAYHNPGVYYMLCGSSGSANHVVIGLGSQIVHDSNPEKPGLVGPCADGYYWVHLLVPAALCA